jgi:CarD family transcriptional regulator
VKPVAKTRSASTKARPAAVAKPVEPEVVRSSAPEVPVARIPKMMAPSTQVVTPMAVPPRSPSTMPPPRPNGNGINGRPNAAPYTNGYVPPPPAPYKNVAFKVGDKAVHPAHGVGEVTAIEQRDIGGSKQTFYVLRILDNGMKVMVPTTAAQQVGLRGIMSEKEAATILTTMKAREVAVDVQPWSRRFRVYTEMIKSGSPVEVAKVLRDMNRLKFDKDLSFGERRLLDQAKSLLLKELAFAKKKSEAEMAEEIRKIFSV